MGRAHDDSGAVGELGEQTRGVLEHPLQLAMCLREKDLYLLVLGASERLRVAEVIDEEPVALVRRNPSGAGVRMGQVPLPLERCHVGPDRRR